MISFAPLGDRAFLARFLTDAEAACWAEAARNAAIQGVEDVVLAYGEVAIFVTPEFDDFDALEARLKQLQPTEISVATGVLHEIPVLYDGEDLPEVARKIDKTEADVITLHSEQEYRIKAVGFLPGFAYAGDLPTELAGLARRDSPRPKVPAGSVAIAGVQTGVYPSDSPGGWHLLGRTPLRIVDWESGRFPIRAGDRIRFVPVDLAEYEARQGECLWTKECRPAASFPL